MDHDRIISRLETAGGEISAAIEATPTSPLRNELTTINILIGDCRAAVVKLLRGNNKDEVYGELIERSQNLRKKLDE